MTKNKLSDLNDHLFAQLERLGDEDLTGDKLTAEIERARAVSQVAATVINNGVLVLKAAEFQNDHPLGANARLPKMMEA